MSQGISEMFTYNHRKPLIFILRKSFFFRNFRPHYLNTFVDFSLEILLTPLKQMRTELFSRVIKYVLLTKKKNFFKRHFVKFNYLFSRKTLMLQMMTTRPAYPVYYSSKDTHGKNRRFHFYRCV